MEPGISQAKKTKQVLCRVELKEPTCRHAAFRKQLIQLLPFIQNEWREENPFTHSEYSWSVSLLRWLLFEGKQKRRKAQYSFASDTVSRCFHSTVCLSRFDEHTAIKVNHDLFDSLRQWVTCFSVRPIHTCTMSFFRLEYGFTAARKSHFWCRI